MLPGLCQLRMRVWALCINSSASQGRVLPSPSLFGVECAWAKWTVEIGPSGWRAGVIHVRGRAEKAFLAQLALVSTLGADRNAPGAMPCLQLSGA